MDWNVGDLERSVSGGPIRSEKMDSSNSRTSSFRKMDSPDDRELIFGLGWGLVCCGNEVGRVRFEKMDSPDDRKIFPLVSGGGRGDEVSLSLDEFISENGLVQ